MPEVHRDLELSHLTMFTKFACLKLSMKQESRFAKLILCILAHWHQNFSVFQWNTLNVPGTFTDSALSMAFMNPWSITLAFQIKAIACFVAFFFCT